MPHPTQTVSALRSCLYEGRVRHERFHPKPHAFAYPIFYVCLDLAETALLDKRLHLFSTGRARRPYSIREPHYLPLGEPLHHPTRPAGGSGPLGSLRERLHRFCLDGGIDIGPDARVLLVTLPRVFGHQFNPVSFHFCLSPDGVPLAAVAEVTNTFGEVKPFLIPPDRDRPGAFHLRAVKEFYVSPYSPLDHHFEFHLRLPQGKLALAIDAYEGEQRIFHSLLSGTRRELSDARLAAFLLKYPLLGLLVVFGIHWQALRLWLKGVPWFRKADRPDKQRDLFRPHPSIRPSSSS